MNILIKIINRGDDYIVVTDNGNGQVLAVINNSRDDSDVVQTDKSEIIYNDDMMLALISMSIEDADYIYTFGDTEEQDKLMSELTDSALPKSISLDLSDEENNKINRIISDGDKSSEEVVDAISELFLSSNL